MALFNYRAVNPEGKSIMGSLQAKDAIELKRKLKESGLVPVYINQGSLLWERLNKIKLKKINIKSIAIFCRQLHTITSSGVNLLRGLEILKQQTRSKDMRKVVEGIYNNVQKGRTLSEAMTDVDAELPPLLVNMIYSGEISGNLDEVLQRLAIFYEKESYLREKVKGAMTYPSILLVIGILMLVFFMNFVLPEITNVITESGATLPAVTRFVIGTVDFIKAYFLWIFIAIIAIILAVRLTVPKEKLRLSWAKILLRLPFISTSIKYVVTSRFLRTFSMMLKAGIPIVQVLETLERILDNALAEVGIRVAIEGVKRGEHLGVNIGACGFFEPTVIHMIDIGEETGQLESILENLADFYDKEAEAWIVKMMAAIEPAFTILIGALIAFLIISMMLPMFNMMSNISPQ